MRCVRPCVSCVSVRINIERVHGIGIIPQWDGTLRICPHVVRCPEHLPPSCICRIITSGRIEFSAGSVDSTLLEPQLDSQKCL